MVINVSILGYCYTENNEHRCQCHKGWRGNKCKQIDCDGLNICKKKGMY